MGLDAFEVNGVSMRKCNILVNKSTGFKFNFTNSCSFIMFLNYKIKTLPAFYRPNSPEAP